MTNTDYKLTVSEVCLVIRNIPVKIAKKITRANGYSFRIGYEDNTRYPLSSDLDSNRVTVKILAGIVIDADPV